MPYLSADCVSRRHLLDSHPARTLLGDLPCKNDKEGSPRDVDVLQGILKVQPRDGGQSVYVSVRQRVGEGLGWMDGQAGRGAGGSYLVRSSALS